MKATFVGGGSLRLIQTLRGALADAELFADGEIFLHDLDLSRAEAVGRMLQRTPEFLQCPVSIRWGDNLEQALTGASSVGVILMAGSASSFAHGNAASLRHGFLGSDNLSPNGAFLAVKGAPIILNIVQQMERFCPDAWLLEFANPVAVLSGMVNRHTKIKALGLCAGFTNHQWDLARVFGRDEWSNDFKVTAAGVNHLSFIMDGTYRGKDLFNELDRLLERAWKLPDFQSCWPADTLESIKRAVANLVRLYRELGVLVFSSEGDGMMHFFYDEECARHTKRIPSYDEVEARVAKDARDRKSNDEWFRSHLTRDLDDAFWNQQRELSVFSKNQDDIFVRILRGISGAEPMEIVSSRLNDGAIEGIADDTVVEYSQRIFKHEIRPAGRFRIPAVAHGLSSSLATHQTALGDACFAGDPKLLAQALQSYPVRAFSAELKNLCRELIAIHRNEMPSSLQGADVYFK